MAKTVLGISAFYHDSAAALLVGGDLVAAAQEERFTRIKHDACFPANAIAYCLKEANLKFENIDVVIFYDKPWLKFERVLESYLQWAPVGASSFVKNMPKWLKEKLFLKQLIQKEWKKISGNSDMNLLWFTEHHHSHAASAFYASPFTDAAVLCADGVGEWVTTSAWLGSGNLLKPIWEQNFPHSLGLLYSALTAFLGFKAHSGEYKVMGLAPYGEAKFLPQIYKHLIDVKADGSYRLNLKYFNFMNERQFFSKNISDVFGCLPREPNDEIKKIHFDIAASVQKVLESTLVLTAQNIQQQTGAKNLVMAGGVALNCTANSKLAKLSGFDKIWIQPAAGDAGGAIGAAFAAWYDFMGNSREVADKDKMKGAFLGPKFSENEIESALKHWRVPYDLMPYEQMIESAAKNICDNKVVGWFQERMEFGPRALGHRSILANASSPTMQADLNRKIKLREGFRPFAPAILDEDFDLLFAGGMKDTYMLFVNDIAEKWREPIVANSDSWEAQANAVKSKYPAITHVDFSARTQVVSSESNKIFYDLLKKVKQLSGVGISINTSFNVRGEPIVNTPGDAIACFLATEMDVLFIGNFMAVKTEELRQRKLARQFAED